MSQGHTPDPILESQQLSPHRPGPLWESRDYSLTLACQSTACYLNTQAGECAAPSCVRLDPNGRCIPFQQSQPPKEESR